MAILENEVSIKLNPSNYKRYEELGYELPKYINYKNEYVVKHGEEIKVRVDDLSQASKVLVTKVCDECKCVMPKQSYSHIIINRNRSDGKDRCKKCARKKGESTKKENISYENSLDFYAKINNKEYLLSEFSNKNKKRPFEVKFGSNDKHIWKCYKCKSEYHATPNNRINGSNCPYCSGQKVNDTNCLWSVNPEVAKLLTNINDGYNVTSRSGEKLFFTCSTCGDVSRKIVKNVVKLGYGCTKCGDGLSYPEKFVIDLLNQLEVNFETQKIFEWSSNKRYDFYIEKFNCIIETHGAQHYQEQTSFYRLGGKSLIDEQLNDKKKIELAITNGIQNYVTIDCSKSNIEFLSGNILNSKLHSLFELSNIDWLRCHEFACNSLVKTVSDLWNTSDYTTVEIGEILRLHQTTVLRYIKQGSELGWCQYDRIESYKRTYKSKTVWNKTKIVQLTKDGDFIRCWDSMTEAAQKLNLHHTSISLACRGKLNSSGGYKWKYFIDYQNDSL